MSGTLDLDNFFFLNFFTFDHPLSKVSLLV